MAAGGVEDRAPITLILPGGGPLGVAFQTGALLCLEDLFPGGFRDQVGAIIGASGGAVTGAFLSAGVTPELVLKSLSGRFPDEIEYFDPGMLMRFDRGRVPNPFAAAWRGVLFLVSELRSGWRTTDPPTARKQRYDAYLRRIESVINLVPKGWFSLSGLEAFLKRNLGRRNGELLGFDRLAIDLFICATDLTSGRAVLFGKEKFRADIETSAFFSKHQYITGESLVEAILCSSAIPFLFTPHSSDRKILADGDVRNTAAVAVAKSLVGARLMVAVNPLVPLPSVRRDGSTSQLFLQTLLTALEGNIVSTLKLEFEEKYHREREGEPSFDIVYFRPSPEDMATMTENSVLNLFRYTPTNAVCGYRSVFETVRDHLEEARRIFARYGYEIDVDAATARHALLQRRGRDADELEDILLRPRSELG